MPRFEVRSFQELSSAAMDEIGETQADLVLARKQVREIILEKYPELQLPSDADNLFDRCLRASKFDVESAASHVHQHFKFLSDFYEIHNEISYFLPSTHSKVYYESQGYCILKHRDHLGRHVFLINYDKMPVNVYKAQQGILAVILMITELTRISVDVQRLGIVVVLNMKGYQLGHARQFRGRQMMGIATRIAQGSFPVRIKGFHYVNCPRVVSMMYSVIRPFLAEKMKSRLHFYGSDLTSFHEHVSPEILPKLLGGKLDDDNFVDVEFSKRISSLDDYYAEFTRCGYMKIENTNN